MKIINNIFLIILLSFVTNSCADKNIYINNLALLEQGKSINNFLEFNNLDDNKKENTKSYSNFEFIYKNKNYRCYLLKVSNKSAYNPYATQFGLVGALAADLNKMNYNLSKDYYYVITENDFIKNAFYIYEMKTGIKNIPSEMMDSININHIRYIDEIVKSKEEDNKNRRRRIR